MSSKIKLIVDVAIFAEGDVLLVKYKDKNKYDHESGWFLPDDLIKYLEHPNKAAVRILHEQLKISDAVVQFVYIESFQGNDKTWHLVFHYKVELPEAPDVVQSNEIEFYDWFPLDSLPQKNEVAHQGWALHTINAILKNKNKT